MRLAAIKRKAKDLKQGDYFSLSARKNATLHHAHILETCTGDKWQKTINNGNVNEGDLFVMGQCGSAFRGQQILNPETDVYIIQ